jgi:transcription-repair coupling factor (superfamily II helicase)
MVSEAVAELKGEELREPAEIKLDLPMKAHLPRDYVSREDLRLEAYRRLATVATQVEVDDVRTEWEDRYGPPPPPAQALLAVGRLRAECARTGVREVTVAKDVARISPLELKASQRIRLQRLHPKAVYKEDLGQLVVPLPRGADAAAFLLDFFAAMVPAEDLSVASATS